MATFTRTKQFPGRGYRESVWKMAAHVVSPLRPRHSPAPPPLPSSREDVRGGARERGRARWWWERGATADEPDGHAPAHRPLPVLHGLRLLEGRQAPRPRRVSF